MSRIKKPIFWALVLFEVYWLIFGIAGMIRMPYLALKIIYGIGGLIVCYSFIISFRKPISDKPIVGITMTLVGLMFIVGGTLNLRELQKYPELSYFDFQPWFDVLPRIFMLMTSVGVLTVILSILGLIMNAITKKSAKDSSLVL